jgi:outer membrane protein
MKHSIYKSVGTLALGLMATAFTQNALAQDTRNLSLDEAIDLSLKNSKQLKISQAKIDEAVASYHQAWNNHLPDVTAMGAYMRVSNPTIDLKLKLPSSSSSSDTGQTTSTGFPKVNQAAYGLVNASLPLFSGMRIHYGAESAKYLEKAAKLDAEHDREAIIENTIEAYDNLYKANEAVILVQENLKQAQQRVSDFTNMEQNGLVARNDLLKTELQESNVELSLLDAQNNLKVTSVNMDLMLGLDEGTMLVADTSAFQTLPDAGTVVDWEQSAMQNRKDMASLVMREKASTSNIKAVKGQYYPSVALTGGYVALDIPNVFDVYNALTAGIGLNYNFGALWKTGAKVHEAQAQLREVQANESMLTDNIRLQINQAYENYLLSRKKIDVYAKAIEQANENYSVTKNKYDNSLATTTDLLEADVAQLQAKLNFAYAKSDAVVAYKKLQETAGVLDNNQVTTK